MSTFVIVIIVLAVVILVACIGFCIYSKRQDNKIESDKITVINNPKQEQKKDEEGVPPSTPYIPSQIEDIDHLENNNNSRNIHEQHSFSTLSSLPGQITPNDQNDKLISIKSK